MPRFGYALGAGGWILIRFAVEVIKRRAWSARRPRARARSLHLTAILGRVWLIAAVVLAARFAGHNADGITAAVVVLAAFTVELAISVVLRAPLAAERRGAAMTRKQKVWLGIGVWIGGTVVLYVIFGQGQKDPSYAPQDEFKLHNYVNLGLLSINQAVIYLFLAGILTCVTMIYVARRMQQRPNRVQTLVELIYPGPPEQHRRRQHGPPHGGAAGSRSSRRSPCSSSSRTSSASSRCRPTPPSTSTSSAGTSRRSRSTRRPRTSRSRSCSRSSCSSPTRPRASARRGRSATSRA